VADTFLSGGTAEVASVLDSDRELAEVVPSEQRDEALHASRAQVLRVERGEWDARQDAARVRGGHGLLVLSGVLVRRVGLVNHIGSELLGRGDLLRPFEHDGEEATLPFAAQWRALEVLRLAVLDRRWSGRMGRFPDVGIALTGRAMLRSRRLANTLVIASHPRLDQRLRLLLWEFADRYGTVHADGVHLRLPLTHEVLAELAAARRPSVSTALGRLSRTGEIERRDAVWVLHGDPPAERLGETAEGGPRPPPPARAAGT
jgi:CRP/FNR family transcriptional regulator, cyclic AMP receptor protein